MSFWRDARVRHPMPRENLARSRDEEEVEEDDSVTDLPPSRASTHPSASLTVPFSVIAQGAEAVLYRTTMFDGQAVVIKERFRKQYRLPELDEQLTRTRMTAEARATAKAWQLSGVHVPALYLVDWQRRWLVFEYIEGPTLRAWLEGLGAERRARIPEAAAPVLQQVGEAVAALHSADWIHGDLTSSNVLIRRSGSGDGWGEGAHELQAVLIDLGLAFCSSSCNEHHVEDKAVDLYVLERAFSSAHATYATAYTAIVWQAYAQHSRPQDARAVQKRLELVRQRGRKRTMVG